MRSRPRLPRQKVKDSDPGGWELRCKSGSYSLYYSRMPYHLLRTVWLFSFAAQALYSLIGRVKTPLMLVGRGINVGVQFSELVLGTEECCVVCATATMTSHLCVAIPSTLSWDSRSSLHAGQAGERGGRNVMNNDFIFMRLKCLPLCLGRAQLANHQDQICLAQTRTVRHIQEISQIWRATKLQQTVCLSPFCILG